MLYLEDAERLLQDAEYGLSSAIINLERSEFCFAKSPTKDNDWWVKTGKRKLAIMYAVVDELEQLVEIAKKEDELLNSEQNDAVCDATDDDSKENDGKQLNS